MGNRFELIHNGRVIATHSTRLACIIEATERKLVVRSRRWLGFAGRTEIREVARTEDGGHDA